MKPHLHLLAKLGADSEAQAFAKSCPDLETVWNTCDRSEWMIWLLRRLKFQDDKAYRRYACWCVRNTPLADGRKVWDLLTDPRSRNVVEVAERFAVGEAMAYELREARTAAYAAYATYAADAATYATYAAAYAYATYAAAYAAYAATYAATYAADAATYAADAATYAATYAADAADADAADAATYAATYAADAARLAARKAQAQQLREMVPFAIVAELAK